jgi:hypothetical protein
MTRGLTIKVPSRHSPEGTEKNHENINQDSRSPVSRIETRTPENEVGVLTIRPRCPVCVSCEHRKCVYICSGHSVYSQNCTIRCSNSCNLKCAQTFCLGVIEDFLSCSILISMQHFHTGENRFNHISGTRGSR